MPSGKPCRQFRPGRLSSVGATPGLIQLARGLDQHPAQPDRARIEFRPRRREHVLPVEPRVERRRDCREPSGFASAAIRRRGTKATRSEVAKVRADCKTAAGAPTRTRIEFALGCIAKVRHARPCAGHPRFCSLQERRGWPGLLAQRRASRFCPAMTQRRISRAVGLSVAESPCYQVLAQRPRRQP